MSRGGWPLVVAWPAAAALFGLASAALLPSGSPYAWRWGLAAFWMLLVAADERALGPLGLREPLVAAGVGGLLLGRAEAGWLCGLVLQAVWPGLCSLGGSRTPASGPAALVALLALVLLPEQAGVWRLPSALAAGLAAGAWGAALEVRLRARNERRTAATPGEPGRRLWTGLIEAGLSGALVIGALVLLPLAIARALLPAWTPAADAGSAATPALLAALFALGGACGQRVRPLRRRSRGAGEGAPPPPVRGDPGGAAGSPEPPPLGARRLWALLLLQAGFENRTLQGAGFQRFLRLTLGRTREPAPAAQQLERDLAAGGPLNTQPVMAAALLGGAARALAEAESTPAPRPLIRLLQVGGPLLAQWGDRAIWGGLRPAAALLAVAATALWPLAAVVYGAASVALSVWARCALYRWGWRCGWEVVRGGRGRVWRHLPRVAESALLPLALGAAAACGAALLGRDAALFSLAAVSFILGAPLGALTAGRPVAWGALCCLAAAGWSWGIGG